VQIPVDHAKAFKVLSPPLGAKVLVGTTVSATVGTIVGLAVVGTKVGSGKKVGRCCGVGDGNRGVDAGVVPVEAL
jgi:hypothetical protein